MIAAIIACAVMWALVFAVLVWLWAPRRPKPTSSRTILSPDDQDAYGRMVPRKPVRERQATPRLIDDGPPEHPGLRQELGA